MLIGYARVSKADGSQSVDLQLDELVAAGVGSDSAEELPKPSLTAVSILSSGGQIRSGYWLQILD